MKLNRLSHKAFGFRGALLILALLLVGCGGSAGVPVQGTAAYLDAARNDPARLQEFVREMPKGGDLHTHLSGVIYAESYLRWAAADNMCADTTTWLISQAPCAVGSIPVANVLADDRFTNSAIDAMSMRNFPLNPPLFGHDHFFATFSLFGEPSATHKSDMLVEAATRAATDNTDYLELLFTFQSTALNTLADGMPWTGALETDYQTFAPGVRQLLGPGRAEIESLITGERAALACDGPAPPAACSVTIRFIQQATRTASNQRVFASLIFGAELAARDARMVGVDLVAPEDNASALANYNLHMQMLAFLKDKYPSLNITLHAGELTGNFVAPADLTFHITQAVRRAGARRIGHGVSLKSEPGWQDLLAYMAQNRIGVAINLTSNAQILGVVGAEHPFRTYFDAGVPVMLGTDDQGVSRGSHTAEFVRAITTYGLKWSDVKRLARTSLEQALIGGGSLWKTWGETPAPVDVCLADTPGSALPSPGCAAYLGANEKAAEQWRLEERLSAFEARHR